ncbi:MAG: hypothetical protein RIS47_1988 [Bacteroidota bacterium]|jgi:hypothetical protein
MKNLIIIALLFASFMVHAQFATNTSNTDAPKGNGYEGTKLQKLPAVPSAVDYSDGGFGFIGATLGTPTILNVNLGAYGDQLGGQISVSGLQLLYYLLKDNDAEKDANGGTTSTETNDDNSFFFAGQANIDLKISATTNSMVAISLAGGTYINNDYETPENSFRVYYIGPAVHFFFHSFFAEVGWAWGKSHNKVDDEVKHFQFPLLQLGFIQRFGAE